MNSSSFHSRLTAALGKARQALLETRAPQGHWVGELSSSALSTATAVCALAVAEENSAAGAPDRALLIERGLDWLAAHANADGGWGDTTRSLSNISTTALCWAAFGAVPGADEKYRGVVAKAGAWLTQRAGGTIPERLAPAIVQRYGKDRTFSVPILTMCALAGRLGSGKEAWRWVLPLPFELAACPHRWFAALRLPVVSYALPALIAIGQARHHHLPSRNPLARVLRILTRAKTLEVLQSIQPSSGGFLEATPLTGFVVMSLAGSGQANHLATRRGVEFLRASARPDGSWPIDTNLCTWLTTLAVNALSINHGVKQAFQPARSGAFPVARFDCGLESPQNPQTGKSAPQGDQMALQREASDQIRDWLLRQQYREEHPYTHAASGGWAWTDSPGGVPDADDTAGAVLALRSLDPVDDATRNAAAAGVRWLLDLQNRDGGIPTFCRGWGALPFDRSSPDLTAHAVRAWLAWSGDVPVDLQKRLGQAIAKALLYLKQAQRGDGSWVPLWFGNQFAPNDENPTYGTGRVLVALQELAAAGFADAESLHGKGIEWLLAAQKADGSWGGSISGPSSVEETALAIEALAAASPPSQADGADSKKRLRSAAQAGARWLIERVESGAWMRAAPIGFYFSRLWYYERLYPLIFTVGALERVAESAAEPR